MKRYIKDILLDSLYSIPGESIPDTEKYFLLYDSFSLFLSQIVREYNPLSFESRISPFSLFGFLSDHRDIPEYLRFAGFKILRNHQESSTVDPDSRYAVLYWLVVELAQYLANKEFPDEITKKQVFPSDQFWKQTIPSVHHDLAKVVLIRKKGGTELTYQGYWLEQDGRLVTIRPDKLMRIRNQVMALQKVDKECHLPMTVHLLDVDAQEDALTPSALVLLPDYLIDITSVSNCFTPFGEMPSIYLLNKITPFADSHHLLIGNCVNQLLDELIFRPDMEWEEAAPLLFRVSELSWATYSNREARLHIETIAAHFKNLKYTIHHEFLAKGVKEEFCSVEPSFYSPIYGLQGRLDLLYEDPDTSKPRVIIELKSGKIFKPNSYGLNHPHYLQTLLYDLLIRSAYPDDPEPMNFILYSSEEEHNLRHAPAIRDWQYEALGVRNQLVVMELQLAQWSKHPSTIYDLLRAQNDNLTGFNARDRDLFYKSYEEARPVVRSYFDAFMKFLVREQMSAKLGKLASDRKGQSQLWGASWQDKDQQYLALSHLIVDQDNSQDSNPVVIFQKSKGTNPLANFRTGDVVLAYPQSRKEEPTRGQLFRCSLVENSIGRVVVRLRARQYRPIFIPGSEWFIEHDHLDSSFRHMYQSMSAVLSMPPERSGLILGLRPPAPPRQDVDVSVKKGLTTTQNVALKGMIQVNDYYLLWGPPGTGKTSVLLQQFVAEKWTDPSVKLLLMGYTNRAVDEICAAVLGIENLSSDSILRIGSRYGTDSAYRDLLLSERNQKLTTRSELKQLLARCRVVCGTIASISGQQGIFDLVDFDYIVIDEASQILEPALVSLLSRGIPYLLIGDHKQLPAVVNQDVEDTYSDVELLHDLDLYYLSNSYFERLFTINQKKEWNWAYGVLTHQGRMHQDLMDYPNLHFYEQLLDILPFSAQRQKVPLMLKSSNTTDVGLLGEQRNLFIPTRECHTVNYKINPEEANKVVQLIRRLMKIRPDLPPEEIGVITPYRSQIATIRHAMAQSGLELDGITVDTVERYQGGAKDVIIISYCINTLSQMHLLTESLTADGIDRKLNVALTRAREQILFLANEDLMSEHPLYEALLYHFVRYELT